MSDRRDFWMGYSYREVDGKLVRKYDCGIYNQVPNSFESTHVREVLPGDPADLDALLAAVDALIADRGMEGSQHRYAKIMEARR